MFKLAKTPRLLLIIGAGIFYVCLMLHIYSTPQSPAAESLSPIQPSTNPTTEPALPKSYRCQKIDHAISITGHADDPAWQTAPWTDFFVDIEGDKKPLPRFHTRAKMLWNDQFLYVYAELEDPHVWGTLTPRNSVIYRDNDFEVFIDPDGHGENYYEFEMNALNTIWELTLPKRYSQGGSAILGTNLPGLISAVHIDGTLNYPGDIDRGWSAEIAFPFSGLATHRKSGPCPPNIGDRWRINFSRVEWTDEIIDGQYHKVPKMKEDNWVWSPQGLVDMHQPEHWGYLDFAGR